MPGSGVRSNNLSDLKKHTGATEFHSSARTTTVSSMQYQSPSMNEQLATIILEKEEVVKLAAILQQ
jgi:copper homeostasis protein